MECRTNIGPSIRGITKESAKTVRERESGRRERGRQTGWIA